VTVFPDLPQGHYGAILCDPPWRFRVWSIETGSGRSASNHYKTMALDDIYALPVASLAKRNCALFLWVTWPLLKHGLETIERWGFTYKTCAFAWMKADTRQMEMWDETAPDMLTGYWTRANSEVCLLATRGRPRRLDAGIRQGIIEPRREHSRKPAIVHDRIERLVRGPYLELFGRQPRDGWTVWGDEVNKFAGTKPDLKLVSLKGAGVA
jgi:N6-adenosine-specific RNA methylase IME4